MSLDYKALWEEVKENIRRLDACERHQFPGVDTWGKTFLTANLVCKRCGGKLEAAKVRLYCEGFKAAGGDPNTVCPGIVSK